LHGETNINVKIILENKGFVKQEQNV